MPQATNRHTTPPAHTIPQLRHAQLFAYLTASVSFAATPTVDAELIALCERLVVIDSEISVLIATLNTIEDGERAGPQLDAMFADRDQVFDRIYDQAEVTTMAGALAMARAAVAIAPPRGPDGKIFRARNSEYLAQSVVEFLSGAMGPLHIFHALCSTPAAGV